jgi:ribosomal protein S18 acetylase RimI-like enzyme
VNSRIRLVDAGESDADALSAAGGRLFVQAYGEYSEPGDLTAHVREHFGRDSVAAELQKPDVSYTIAYDAGAIAGFIKLRRGPVPDGMPVAEAIEVQQLYVDTDRQRRGVGGALMDRAVAAAREEGYPGLWLSVWQDADWALGFYEVFGFRKAGTAEFRLGRSRFMDYLMWFPLQGRGRARRTPRHSRS